MPATEIAQVPRVHLEGGDLSADERKSVAFESDGKRLDPCRLLVKGLFAAPFFDVSHFRDPRRNGSSHMESFAASFRI